MGIKNLKLKDRTNVEDSVMFLIQILLQTYCQDKYCPDNLNCHENVLLEDFISRELYSLLEILSTTDFGTRKSFGFGILTEKGY